MRSSIKLFSTLLILSIITSSCVSNYVASNNSYYKYPSTGELLAHNNNSKGPNASTVSDNNLIEKKNTSKIEIVSFEDMNFAIERAYTREAQSLLMEAKTYLGTPYRYGGTTKRGIDCSSFVQHVFDAFDISLPRTSAMQALEGQYVAKENLKKGDLIFFAQSSKSRVSHVGIVERVEPDGEIFFIHASSSKGVTISSLDGNYWKSRYRSGKRILSSNFEENNIVKNKQTENDNLVKYDF